MVGEEIKWGQLAHHQLMSQQRPHFSPHSTVIKAQISERMICRSISDVVIASVYSEKTHQRRLIMIIIIIMNE